jgi:toluene monooxygenase system protein E
MSDPAEIKDRSAQKTYWHFLSQRRIPSDYEIVSSALLYHPAKGFSVNLPSVEWRQRYGASLTEVDWEAFSDPRETTYASYVARQARSECLTHGLLEQLESATHDEALLGFLSSFVFPLRFPLHALQMVAAYVGHLAPASKIAIAAAFQAADELRRIEHIAYRMGICRQALPRVSEDARATWQSEPAWQPLRRAVERLLVTYDWGEAFYALEFCIKAALDSWVMVDIPQRAGRLGDPLLAPVFHSLNEDCQWHRAWSKSLLERIQASPANRALIEAWERQWSPMAAEAIRPLASAP